MQQNFFAATKNLFAVPNFVAVTKPFFLRVLRLYLKRIIYQSVDQFRSRWR